MRPLLVTGFAPFLGEALNPSQRVVEALLERSAARDRIETLVLPVSFQRASQVLLKKWSEGDFSGVLMFGQAGRPRISLERVALNWMETQHPDEDGFHPVTGPIRENCAPAWINSLPLSAWRDRIEKLSLPVEVSHSAGTFVCNRLLFDVSQEIRSPILFVHVPFLPEQAKSLAMSMDLDSMLVVADFLINEMAREGGS